MKKINYTRPTNIIILMLLLLFSVACGSTKQKSRETRVSKVPPRKTQPKEKEVVKPDKEVKEEVSEEVTTEKTDESSEKEEKILKSYKDIYKIELLLPLSPLKELDENEDDESALNNWNAQFMRYLAGFSLAIDEQNAINSFRLKLEVKASGDFDSDIKSDAWIPNEKADIVVGGVSRASVEKLQKAAEMTNQLYVSPWTPYLVSETFEHSMQLTPSVEAHVHHIMSHVLAKHKLEQIYVLLPEEASERMNLVESYFEELPNPPALNKVILDDIEKASFEDHFDDIDTNIVIIPFSKDKAFLHSTFTKVENMPIKNYKFYCIPPIDKYDLLLDYFESLDIFITTDYIPIENFDWKVFMGKFIQKYNDVPGEWGVKGYDHATYLSKQIKASKDVSNILSALTYYEGLGMEVSFPEDLDKQSRQKSALINEGVKIMRLKDAKFQEVPTNK